MPDRNFSAIAKIVLAFIVLLLEVGDAMAYVGPGADVAFISYAMTLLFWVATVFSAVLLWPVYALLRKIRGAKKKIATTSPAATSSVETHADDRAQP